MAGRSIRTRAPGPERPGRGNPLWAASCDYARNLLGSGPLLRKARARRLSLYADELVVAVAGGDDSDDLEELLAALPARVPRPARALGLRPRENLARIARVFGLGEAEAEVLRFLLCLNLEDGLSSLTSELGELSSAGVARAIATATALPHRAVAAAIAPESPLFASGLVELDPCAPMTVKSKFDVAPVLLDLLERRIADDDALRAVFVPPVPAPELSLGDFAALPEQSQQVELAARLVAAALERGERGVNVLLFGPTGTGKTQMARLICQLAGGRAHEARAEGGRGEHLRDDRLRGLMSAQRLLAESEAVLIFDEAEDVFETDLGALFGGGAHSRAKASKLWLGRLLEDSRVPMLWIANSVDGVDPAYLRRFSYTIAVSSPNLRERERLWRRATGEALDPEVVGELAKHPLSAGHIFSVARSAELIGADGEHAVLDRLAASMTASRPTPSRQRPVAPYDFGLVETDVPVGPIVTAIANAERIEEPMSICLSGPPGTGKSAFAEALAQRAGRPLVRKLVSDFLSMWVGQSEELIGRAFEEAERDGAVLLLDEADTLLYDRRLSRARHEASLTNEVLQRMELSRAVVAMTTNLVDKLDPAVERRFLIHVRFDYLSPKRASMLFDKLCHELHAGHPDAALRRRIEVLGNMTPGDAAAVRRQFRLLRPDDATPAALAAELERVCRAKEARSSRNAGFRVGDGERGR